MAIFNGCSCDFPQLRTWSSKEMSPNAKELSDATHKFASENESLISQTETAVHDFVSGFRLELAIQVDRGLRAVAQSATKVHLSGP